MKRTALVAAFCSFTLAACLVDSAPPAKAPKIGDGRATMAKIGGRPLPVFEFSGRLEAEGNKIVAVRAHVSTTGDLYRRGAEGYELVEPKTLEGSYHANVGQVRSTVDPAKEEALATYLNGEGAKVAFQWEIEWTAPEATEVQTTRSIVFESDNANIASAGMAREIKDAQ